jgi:hypothetical protein
MDQCPIPTLLEHGNFSQVLFNNVEKFYAPRGDIMCYYTLTEKFIPRRKDWIGIFKVSVNTKGLGTRVRLRFQVYYVCPTSHTGLYEPQALLSCSRQG